MAVLTPRERLKRAIEHQEVDRPPIFDKLRNTAVIEHYAGRPLGYGDRETVCRAAGAAIDCICNVRGPAEPGIQLLEDGRKVEHQLWTSWYERAAKDPQALMNIMRAFIDAPVDRAAFKAQVADYVKDYEQLQAWCGAGCHVAPAAYGVGLDGLMQTGGLEVFSFMLMEGTGIDEEYLERHTQNAIAWAKELAPYKLSFFAHNAEDIAWKGGTLVSHDYLRRNLFPRLKRITDAWHEAGYYYQFHSDGDLRAVVPNLIAAGVDAIHPMEKLAGMDVEKLFRQFGHTVTYCGGVDVSQLLPYGTPEEVAAETRRIIEATGGTSLWIGSTTELNNAVPLANFKAMAETVRGWKEMK